MMYINDDKRIDWIDCSKGIAILLVILGHTTMSGGSPLEQILRGGIFSFHMPLFFILSCVTFKLSGDDSQFMKKTRKAFKHLIFSALILYGLRTLINIVNNFQSIEWKSYIAEKINVLVYGSGVNVNISNATIPAFGMMWFFVALFFGRTLFDYLHLRLTGTKYVLAIVMCTIVGVALGNIQWLPLSMDVALAAMPFFWFGNYLKKVDLSDKCILKCLIFLVVWGLTFAFSYFFAHDYMELAERRYPIFPLCYVTAITGTMFIAYFSQLASKFIARPFVYIGRSSIYFYCVHSMDYIYSFIWKKTDNNIVNGLIRIIVDVILGIILIECVKKINNRLKDNGELLK